MQQEKHSSQNLNFRKKSNYIYYLAQCILVAYLVYDKGTFLGAIITFSLKYVSFHLFGDLNEQENMVEEEITDVE